MTLISEINHATNRGKILRFMNVIMVFYAIVAVIRALADYFDLLTQLDSCAFTEFLINYQAGYVRRGLLGECLYQLSSITGADPRCYIAPLCLFCFFFAVGIMLYLFRKHNLCWWLLPLSCCLAAPEVLRKDYLMILLCICTMYMLNKYKGGWQQYLPAILFLLMMQLHETCIFYFTGGVLVMYWFDQERKITAFSRVTVSSVILIAALVTLLSKGSNDIAQRVHDSWIPLMPAEFGLEPQGTISSLGWGIRHAVNFSIGYNFFAGEKVFVVLPLLYVLTIYVVPKILFMRRLHEEVISIDSEANRFLSIFFLQFLMIAPLSMFLMCDQARVFMFWVVSTILIYMFVPKSAWSELLPGFYTRFVYSIQKVIFHKRFFILPMLLVLFIGIPAYYTHYETAFTNSIAGRIISTCELLLQYLF